MTNKKISHLNLTDFFYRIGNENFLFTCILSGESATLNKLKIKAHREGISLYYNQKGYWSGGYDNKDDKDSYSQQRKENSKYFNCYNTSSKFNAGNMPNFFYGVPITLTLLGRSKLDNFLKFIYKLENTGFSFRVINKNQNKNVPIMMDIKIKVSLRA